MERFRQSAGRSGGECPSRQNYREGYDRTGVADPVLCTGEGSVLVGDGDIVGSEGWIVQMTDRIYGPAASEGMTTFFLAI
mmetsp:Transcript_5234/g.15139  ORF Transcript_5234/g.15139 Transcript_5234/m.15139 type:complete len:80 (-) Transcript_5234:15-254(-)